MFFLAVIDLTPLLKSMKGEKCVSEEAPGVHMVINGATLVSRSQAQSSSRGVQSPVGPTHPSPQNTHCSSWERLLATATRTPKYFPNTLSAEDRTWRFLSNFLLPLLFIEPQLCMKGFEIHSCLVLMDLSVCLACVKQAVFPLCTSIVSHSACLCYRFKASA